MVKALDLLSALVSHPAGLSYQQLSEQCGMPRTTVRRIVQTLIGYGLVAHDRGSVRLTEQFHSWSAPNWQAIMRHRYRPLLERAASEIGELVVLGTMAGDAVEHLDLVEADHMVQVAPPMTWRMDVRRTAVGKLCLSRRRDLMGQVTDPGLRSELETIKRTGVAWNRGEMDAEVISLAVPGFQNEVTEPVIAVAWPAQRFTEEAAARAVDVLARLRRE